MCRVIKHFTVIIQIKRLSACLILFHQLNYFLFSHYWLQRGKGGGARKYELGRYSSLTSPAMDWKMVPVTTSHQLSLSVDISHKSKLPSFLFIRKGRGQKRKREIYGQAECES